jgi:hypothetical protein
MVLPPTPWFVPVNGTLLGPFRFLVTGMPSESSCRMCGLGSCEFDSACSGLPVGNQEPDSGGFCVPCVTANTRGGSSQRKDALMTGIRLIAVAAMLAGSFVAAVAQTSPSMTAPSAATPGATKCWDSVMDKVRNETIQAPGSTFGSGSTTGPSSMGSSAGAGSSASGSAGPTAEQRPAEARGLPDCRH